MKILMVNKFLYPNGGSETYIFKLGEYLESHGHEVSEWNMKEDALEIMQKPIHLIWTFMEVQNFLN